MTGRGRYQALLVDAGGTLLPDNLPDQPGVREVRLRRLAALLPELSDEQVAQLLDQLHADVHAGRDALVQRTEAAIADRLAGLGPAPANRAGEVRRALAQPTGHEHPPFPGHRDLLLAAGELGLRRVLVSNTGWVGDDDWVRWWMPARRLDGLIDAVVTSCSVGRRKPDRGMFDRALELAGCPPEACVYAGDKEAKDVEPALALGMTVIKVAIQEPPSPTRAQRMVASLAEAVAVLRELQLGGTATPYKPLTSG